MEIHIGNRVAEVELVSKEGNKVVLLIDGVEQIVDVVMAENGVCSILQNGKSYNAELTHSESGTSYHVNTKFSSYNVDIIDNQTKYLRLRQKGEERQNDRVISPMPGKIVSIPVKEGQLMQAGDTVVVIEAMKMQSNYKVTGDCIIRKILVEEGNTVKSGQELILLDLQEPNE
jgi:biotin carboxyl carrier protein